MTQAQFSHVMGDTEWFDMPLETCLEMVAAGTARECDECNGTYDDGMRNFHCLAQCPQCDRDYDTEI